MFERLHACLKSVAHLAQLCSRIPAHEAQKSLSQNLNHDGVLDITLNRDRRLGLWLKGGPRVRVVLVGDVQSFRISLGTSHIELWRHHTQPLPDHNDMMIISKFQLPAVKCTIHMTKFMVLLVFSNQLSGRCWVLPNSQEGYPKAHWSP